MTKIINLCKKGPNGPFLHVMTHISTVILDKFYVFHCEGSKISNMTKYGEFTTYFPLEKLTKIVNLCKKGPKGPFLHVMTHISMVILD